MAQRAEKAAIVHARQPSDRSTAVTMMSSPASTEAAISQGGSHAGEAQPALRLLVAACDCLEDEHRLQDQKRGEGRLGHQEVFASDLLGVDEHEQSDEEGRDARSLALGEGGRNRREDPEAGVQEVCAEQAEDVHTARVQQGERRRSRWARPPRRCHRPSRRRVLQE